MTATNHHGLTCDDEAVFSLPLVGPKLHRTVALYCSRLKESGEGEGHDRDRSGGVLPCPPHVALPTAETSRGVDIYGMSLGEQLAS